jgi:isopentenyl diphosphate isomerase/L-lactate dehydrogenase-like FMN-dependent dehydrogenase
LASRNLPQSFEEWEILARSTIDEERFRFIAGGAGSDEGGRANVESFRKWRVVPRILRNVEKRDNSVSVFGHTASAPIMLAPVRALGYLHREGDFAVARVAAELGLPLVVSTFATAPIENIANAMDAGQRWFQLYPGKDKEIMRSLVHRAEASGYSALVITVDKAGNYPHYQGPRGHDFEKYGAEVYFSDPVFKAKYGSELGRRADEAMKIWKDIRLAPGITADEFRLVASWTKLPVIVKGVLHPDDARLAAELGAAGVIVSNHGGRSLDGEVGSLDALLEVRRSVGKDFPVFLDGGVRSGTDVLKALTLGANAVLIGKAYVLGLAAAGEQGVRKVLRDMISEFDSAMAICGARRVGDIDRSMITES